MSQHSKSNFDIFRQLSLTDILSNFNTIEKIKTTVYYKALNPETQSESHITIDEIKKDLISKYGLESNETLETFVHNQFKYNMAHSFSGGNFNMIIEHNKQQAELTAQQCSIKQKETGGEFPIILELIYILLFQYFKEFNIKEFIPILYNVGNSKNILENTRKAITYSKLYYLKYGTYLPIVYSISYRSPCSHTVSYLCLPSEDIHNQHQFSGVLIDTSTETQDSPECSIKNFIFKITKTFKDTSSLFNDKISLIQTKNKCVVDLQREYGICANYSLGIVLNYLFQENHLPSKILDVCDSLDKKGTTILKNILITIGNVSNLFHKFLRYVVFEPLVKYELYNELIILQEKNINFDKRNPFTYLLSERNNNAINLIKTIQSVSDLISDLLKNYKKDEKNFLNISNFLKECSEAIHQWDLLNLEKIKIKKKKNKKKKQKKIPIISKSFVKYYSRNKKKIM